MAYNIQTQNAIKFNLRKVLLARKKTNGEPFFHSCETISTSGGKDATIIFTVFEVPEVMHLSNL